VNYDSGMLPSYVAVKKKDPSPPGRPCRSLWETYFDVVGDVLGKGVKGLAGYGGHGCGQISAYYNVSSAQDLAGGSIDLGIGGGEGWGAVATSCSAPAVRANWPRGSP